MTGNVLLVGEWGGRLGPWEPHLRAETAGHQGPGSPLWGRVLPETQLPGAWAAAHIQGPLARVSRVLPEALQWVGKWQVRLNVV